jgi:LmbE family N-acetylglucosaminyl deacetylase
MLAAADYLGAKNVTRLDLEDGMMLSYDETLIRMRYTVVIRTFKPHVIVTHYPYPLLGISPTCDGKCKSPRNWDDLGYHPDHQTVGKRVLDTTYGGGSVAGNAHAFRELDAAGLAGWQAEELYFFGLTTDTISHYLPLDEELLQKKIDAQLLHCSQYQNNRQSLTEDQEFIGSRIAALLPNKPASVTYAEGYLGFF